MASSPPELGLKIMRGLFTRGDKDEMPAELRGALSLLQLPGLEELEHRFLATEAFLKPWAVFRDSLLVLKPDAMADATVVAASEGGRGISRTDILWFYTQFDEDMYRHDPCAEDEGICVTIDKRSWRVQEYEKHLFAWLLQTFKVGKAHNPWGFDFFQLRNICTAWQAVFVPVVNAVRASYSKKGRRHYGRLALFVEERCASDLACPRENLDTPQGDLFSSTPYRIVGMPKDNGGAGPLTRKHYDETEKELRTVYPQYGGLVERPKFKHKMEEWLEEQRARANLRRAAERTHEVGDTCSAKDNRDQKGYGSVGPIKRYTDNVRRSLSRSVSQQTPQEEPKSPLHGVTRQLNIPDDTPSPHLADEQHISKISRPARSASVNSSDTTIITPWPRPGTWRKPSEQSACGPKRVPSPFSIDDDIQIPQEHYDAYGSVSVRRGRPSAIPQLSYKDPQSERQDVGIPSISDHMSHAEPRIPGYEAGEWEQNASMTKPRTIRTNTDRTPEPTRPTKPATRLPGPIKPVPYGGHLRVASEERYRDVPSRAFGDTDTALPKSVAWPGASPTSQPPPFALDEHEDFIPPVPTKSPRRPSNARGYVGNTQTRQMERYQPDRNVTRIVSKENIRSALGGHSRDGSAEDIPLSPYTAMSQDQNAGTTSGGTRLQTYNTHMFPRKERRKGTPVGGWVGAPKGRNATG